MNKYEPIKFISKLGEKVKGRDIPNCPYCGGEKFTTTEKFATILIGEDLENVNLGPSIPTGMLICENCGHVEFFALGSLGMLKRKEEPEDEK